MVHRKRLSLGVLIASTLTFGILGVVTAYAGTDGQYLSLHDVYGSIYSAKISGDNQNCSYVTIGFQWPDPYLNTGPSPAYWWQYYYGGEKDGVCDDAYVGVQGYLNTNYTDPITSSPYVLYYAGYYYPPHNQGTGDNWSSCQMDRPGGGVACAAGYETE